MASTSFINTFSEMTITDGNPTDGASFTKEQLEQWAKNAAEVSNKTDSDSGSDNETKTKSTRKQRKTKNKQKRGENQPKRPMSAYMLFLNENREAIKAKLLEDSEKVSVGEIARAAGLQWKALEDTAKDVFIDKSITLKEEYAAAMEIWRTEHPEEASAPKEKKEPKEKKAKKAKVPAKPVNLNDAPEAPPGISGPFSGYLSKIVKNSDGKSQFKEFAEAVSAAMELGDDCGGITRTSRGWSLRKAITLSNEYGADGARKEFSYLKTKFVSDELAATAGVTTEETKETKETEETEETKETTPEPTEEKPKKKRGRPTKKKEPTPEPEPVPVVEEAGGKSDYEAETDGESEEQEPVFSEDEVETISWEFKGKDYELDEKTGKVYAEDEDGEYELVGYRKTREVEVMTKKGKKIKKEVYIDEPWKN